VAAAALCCARMEWRRIKDDRVVNVEVMRGFQKLQQVVRHSLETNPRHNFGGEIEQSRDKVVILSQSRI
jgi:hypothetical protein